MKIVHTAITLLSAKNFVLPLAEYDVSDLNLQSEIWISQKIDNTSQITKFPRNIKVREKRLNLTINIIKNISQLFYLTKSFIKSKPNVLIAHFSRGAILPLLAARLANIEHRIYFNHGLPFLGHKGILRIGLRLLEYFNCLLASEIITVNNRLIAEIDKLANGKKIRTLGAGSCCGVEDEYFLAANQNKVDILKKELKISSQDITILYVGRPVKRKGYLIAYDSFCQLREKYNINNIKLLMAGISRQDILCAKKDIDNFVYPLGFINDMQQLYDIADIIFLPSFHEGMPYCLLEGGAKKCAIIASKLPGLEDIIIEGKTGYFIDPYNTKQIVNVMLQIINAPYKIQQMGNHSFENIKKFSRNNILSFYADFVTKLTYESNKA